VQLTGAVPVQARERDAADDVGAVVHLRVERGRGRGHITGGEVDEGGCKRGGAQVERDAPAAAGEAGLEAGREQRVRAERLARHRAARGRHIQHGVRGGRSQTGQAPARGGGGLAEDTQVGRLRRQGTGGQAHAALAAHALPAARLLQQDTALRGREGHR
jgi:hypothetical protein